MPMMPALLLPPASARQEPLSSHLKTTATGGWEKVVLAESSGRGVEHAENECHPTLVNVMLSYAMVCTCAGTQATGMRRRDGDGKVVPFGKWLWARSLALPAAGLQGRDDDRGHTLGRWHTQ